MSTEPKSIKIPYHKILSIYLANIMSSEYNEWGAMTFKEAGLTYLHNKLNDAHKAEEMVLKQLKVVDKSIREQLEADKDFHSDLLFEIFRLEKDQQLQVKEFVESLKTAV